LQARCGLGQGLSTTRIHDEPPAALVEGACKGEPETARRSGDDSDRHWPE